MNTSTSRLAPLLADVRTALRSLRRSRGSTTIAIVTLSLGLTLAVTVLAVANAYLVRSMPYPVAERLYSVRYSNPAADREEPEGMEALDWSSLDGVIEQEIAWDLDVFYMLGESHADATPGAWVTPGFVQGLGVRPVLGRGLEPADFVPGAPQSVLISDRLWRERFGGRADVLGARFRAYVSDRPEEAETFTVVGVLPAAFWHFNAYTEVLAPLRAPTYPYLVRLRAGVSPALAAQRISTLVRAGARGVPDSWSAHLVPTHEAYVASVRPVLGAVAAAAALVLLIACANVAVLLLVRGNRRARELALRGALGATRFQISRLLAIEAMALGAAATAIAVALATATLQWLAPLVERQLGRRVPGGTAALGVDGRVLVGAALCGLLAIVAVAAAPLLVSWRTGVHSMLRATGRATGGPGGARTRSALIALEVSVSLALLAASTLMVDSALRMLQVDFGMSTRNVWTASLSLRQQSYPDADAQSRFYRRLLQELEEGGLPGAAIADWWPLQQARPQPLRWQGPGGEQATSAAVLDATGGYFDALGIPLRSGRVFDDRDRAGAPAVAIVSETLARRLAPDGRAVGLRVQVGVGESAHGGPTPAVEREIVGVVRDVRQNHTDEDLADLYLPLLQSGGRFASVYLRDPPGGLRALEKVRTALSGIDPEVALGSLQALHDSIDRQRAGPRFLASLLAAFSLFAGALALIGLYGVIAYAVRQREAEIAVRMAIGADQRAVTGLFLRQGLWVMAAGLLLGLVGALGLGRLLATQLFGVTSSDPRVLVATALTFGALGLLAIWRPAHRAAATDPSLALRSE